MAAITEKCLVLCDVVLNSWDIHPTNGDICPKETGNRDKIYIYRHTDTYWYLSQPWVRELPIQFSSPPRPSYRSTWGY